LTASLKQAVANVDGAVTWDIIGGLVMFGYEDKRTPAERDKAVRAAEKTEINQQLAVGFTELVGRILSEKEGIEVGFVDTDYGCAKILVQNDVQYELRVTVSRNSF
jgi:hypothetical protein